MEQNQHAVTNEAIGSACRMHRGDLRGMGQHGYVTITGWSRDMVIVGGENICPREIKERDGRLNAAQTAGVAGLAVLRIAA